jgi:hypothetical protein
MGVNPQSEGLPPLFLIISVTNEIEHKKNACFNRENSIKYRTKLFVVQYRPS